MTDRYKLLNNWLYQALDDDQTIITESKTALEIYGKLYEMWLSDCQKAFKEIMIDVKINKT